MPLPSITTLDAQVAPILKAHEDSITSQIPSFLTSVQPESPSAIFGDYVKSGTDAVKQKAGDAMNALTSFAHNVKQNINNPSGTVNYDRESFFNDARVPGSVPDRYKAPVNNAVSSYIIPTGDPQYGDFNVATSAALADIVGNQENQRWDPNPPIRHNHNGTFDMGLAQLNSAMVTKLVKPYFQNVLNKSFDITNPQDNLVGASVILNANATLFQKITGRMPRPDELKEVYNEPALYARKVKKEEASVLSSK